MRTYLRRLRAGLAHSGPDPDTRPTPIPARGDAVGAWLKAQRDALTDGYGQPPAWHVLDDVLRVYRLHADTRTPLNEHVCEGRVAGDCECMEVAR